MLIEIRATIGGMLVRSLLLMLITACCVVAALSGCLGDNVPAGRILVRNDSRDREFNTIVVAAGGASRSLKPGGKFLLPPGTSHFSVSREYKEYTRRYTVACPPLGDKGIVVKTIDIHLNRIQGGCKTTSASHR
jgi:hypothetical protein